MSPKTLASCDSADLRDHMRWKYPDYALQYYAAARFAHLAGLTPGAGNLFHHAIELMLKHRLLKRFAWEVLKKKPYQHNLDNLWKQFKADVSDAGLDRFDVVIAGLHRFEEIRYPEELVRHGASMTLAMKREHISQPWIATGPLPNFDLALDEIDGLMLALFEKCSVNIRAFPQYFRGCAGEYLLRDNPVWEAAIK